MKDWCKTPNKISFNIIPAFLKEEKSLRDVQKSSVFEEIGRNFSLKFSCDNLFMYARREEKVKGPWLNFQDSFAVVILSIFDFTEYPATFSKKIISF